MATPRKKKNQDVLDKAVDYYLDCQDFHTDFLRGVKRRSDAYHAIKDTIAVAAVFALLRPSGWNAGLSSAGPTFSNASRGKPNKRTAFSFASLNRPVSASKTTTAAGVCSARVR